MLWTFLFHRNLSITFENFNVVSQPIAIGKGFGGVALEIEEIGVQGGIQLFG
jgi:hypothetical protein